MEENLASAARHALTISRETQFSWQRSGKQFPGNLQPFNPAINKPES
jgi:hypothetical protein